MAVKFVNKTTLLSNDGSIRLEEGTLLIHYCDGLVEGTYCICLLEEDGDYHILSMNDFKLYYLASVPTVKVSRIYEKLNIPIEDNLCLVQKADYDIEVLNRGNLFPLFTQ